MASYCTFTWQQYICVIYQLQSPDKQNPDQGREMAWYGFSSQNWAKQVNYTFIFFLRKNQVILQNS